MSTQINKSNLVELTLEEQQLLSGGCCGCKPRSQACGYKSYHQPCDAKPYYGDQPYQDYGYFPK